MIFAQVTKSKGNKKLKIVLHHPLQFDILDL